MNICEILKKYKNIAVVGFSADGFRDSNRIARFLVNEGYNVVGVNPNIKEKEVLGIKVFKSLSEIPFKIDIVNVFRRSEFLVDVAKQSIPLRPAVFWAQLGIENFEAEKILSAEGITVIQNKCILIEHNRCN